jgi:hypothetical protein
MLKTTPSRTNPPLAAAFLAAAFIGGIDATPADAQRTSQQNPQSGAARVEFAEDPLRLHSLGLTMHVPVGSEIRIEEMGPSARGVVQDARRGWVIQVQSAAAGEGQTTRKEFTDRILQNILSSFGSGARGGRGAEAQVLLREENLVLPGGEADRFYVKYPRGTVQRSEEDWLVRGITALHLEGSRYVTVQLDCTAEAFERARLVYETVVATLDLADTEHVAAERAVLVQAATELLRSYDEEKYRELIGAGIDRWERLNRPAASGAAIDAEELGFRRFRVSIDKLGAVKGIPERQWGPEDREEGLTVRLDARLLVDDMIWDTDARYFASFDGERETWQVRMAGYNRQSNSRLGTWTEMGARDKRAMTITTGGSGQVGETIRPVIQGRGYVSQAVGFVLPLIMVRSEAVTDYGFYVYQSRSSTIRFRKDTLRNPPGNPDVWEVQTWMHEDAEPQTSAYRADGTLIRTSFPDGRVWEPIELNQLVRLWDRAGLPTGSIGRD